MIEINNLTTNPVDGSLVKKVAQTVLEGENKKETDLSIAFVGQGRMRELNKKYLGKNRTTDVLSFSEKDAKGKSASISGGLGEVIISSRDVKKNAKRYGISYERELVKIIIHGILHLLGYEHERFEKEAEKMLNRQEYYLGQLNTEYKQL